MHKRVEISRVILCVFLLSAGSITGAQDRDVLLAQINQTKAYLLAQRALPEYRDAIRKSVLNYEEKLDTHCKEVSLDFDSVDVRDTLLALLEKDEKGQAIAGAWRESIPGIACIEKRRFNVQIDVTRKGLRFTTTFPGDAAGNQELQFDTLRNIEMNLQVLGLLTKRSCHLEVIDTQLIGAKSTFQQNGTMTPWMESWIVRTCGKAYVVPINFIPDSKGTAISVGTSEIKPSE